nr:reverse transcriptase domain-containing protein [Tanacetum cinerariifolium]
MENASNQDDGKDVDNVVSNHGKAVDSVVSNLFQPEIDTQILNAFMEVDLVFNPVGMDVDVELEDTMIGVRQSSTSIMTPIHVDFNKDNQHGSNVLLPLFDQEYNQTMDMGEANADMESPTPVGATQDLSALTRKTTLGTNVSVPPTIQTRKEYYRSCYQRRKETNNNSQDDSYDFVYNGLPKEHCLLKEQPPRVSCRAKKIQYEFPTFCCMNGKTTLQALDIPPELYNLFTSQYHLGKMFRKNIRAYNINFSFSSMGVTLDKRYNAKGSGVYTFCVQGGIYHIIDQLVPRYGDPREIVTILSRILAPNPYVLTFRSLGNLGPLDKCKVELTASVKVDQRLYNRPTMSECMRTRNFYFPNNSSVTIPRRRNKRRTPNIVEPELRTIVEVAPMVDNRTTEELLQAPTKGYGEAIVISKINADHFEIKTNLLQLVQTNPFHGFERENPHTHINNFKRITLTMKFRDVPNDVIKLMMFPYSLEGSARVWYDKGPPNSILTWEDLVNKFVNQFFPPSKTTHLKNEISRFTQRFEETFGEAWERFKEMLRACPHHEFTELAQIDTFYNGLNDNDQDSLNAAMGGNLLNDIFSKKLITPVPVKAVAESCVTFGGPHAHYNCDATNSNQPSVCVTMGTYNQVAPQNHASNYMAPPGFAPVQNSQNRFNQNQGQGNNFNRGNNFYGNQPFQVPNQGFQSHPFQVPNNPVQQGFSNEFLSYKKVNDQIMRNMQSQINTLKGEFKNEIQNTMKTKQTVLMEQHNAFPNNLQNMLSGFFQNQSSTSGTLPSNTIPNPKATNQMEKFFQIFQDLHFDISFADALLLMPKFASTIKSLLTNKDKLFELAKIPLNENCSAMLLKNLLENLGDPGKFLIPFVGFEADPRVPLILGRSFLRTGCALIDVYREEITIRRGVCLGNSWFSKNSLGGNPTSTFELILFDSSPSLTPIEGSDFILKEIEAYLKDESISPKYNHVDCDLEGDICLIEKLLNNDPFQLPSVDLKQGEVVKEKSSIEEPPDLKLKDLSSHLGYAYLEGVDKLPVIIAKDLKVNEIEALLKVLKSHKRAIAWKITDIKGIDPRFCTHKILIKEDYKPAVQSQRWANPKIHEVIKKEVIKLLDARMIYPISDSPWVSPIHCLPKKCGIIVVENEENELVPTR